MDFFITGTHAYGPAGPDSDLDIVVKAADSILIMNFLNLHNITMYRTEGQDEYGATGGFYFDLTGIKVNIIIATDDNDYAKWKRKTDTMKKFPEIPDRDLRVAIFNSNIPFEQLKETVDKIYSTTLKAWCAPKTCHSEALSKIIF
jgi:hypothetical protein